MWTVKREELVEAVNCPDLSRSLSNSGDADRIKMGLIGKTRRAKRLEKQTLQKSSLPSALCVGRGTRDGRERKLKSSIVERCKSP